MNTIDLTTAASALAYLRSLPADQAISLPGHLESTTEGDAVRQITGCNANEWANNHRQWDWTAGELVAQLEIETEPSVAEIDPLPSIGAKTLQTRHYGIDFRDDEIPMFEASSDKPARQAYLTAPEQWAPYWRWTDGYVPASTHSTPVSRELAERAIRAWYPTWGYTPEEIEAEVSALRQPATPCPAKRGHET